jgi:hypothetical protein
MNVYGKMVIIGIIGLVTVGILLGIFLPGPGGGGGAGIEISEGAIIDIFILYIILELPSDDPLRTILLVLWFLGFFAASSEE